MGQTADRLYLSSEQEASSPHMQQRRCVSGTHDCLKTMVKDAASRLERMYTALPQRSAQYANSRAAICQVPLC